MGQNGVFVFGRAYFSPWALCFDTPDRENAIEKPQTKFDKENFQYHSKSSFAGKNWFMRAENSHAILIIQEPQVNCVICKLETAEVLFYMHDLKKKKKKADTSSTDNRNNVHYHAHHPPSNFTRLVLFLFFSSPSLTLCSAWWVCTWPRAMWQVPWPCSTTSWSQPFPPRPSRPFLAVSSAATVYLCCVVFSSTPPFTVSQTDSPAQVSNLGGGEKIPPSFVVFFFVGGSFCLVGSGVFVKKKKNF